MTWSGRFRAPIDGVGVYPRPLQDPLPVWIAVGGNPQSVSRAGVRAIELLGTEVAPVVRAEVERYPRLEPRSRRQTRKPAIAATSTPTPARPTSLNSCSAVGPSR